MACHSAFKSTEQGSLSTPAFQISIGALEKQMTEVVLHPSAGFHPIGQDQLRPNAGRRLLCMASLAGSPSYCKQQRVFSALDAAGENHWHEDSPLIAKSWISNSLELLCFLLHR